jgi:hypothetical protein
MRAHATWCASKYRDEIAGWGACDCGAEQENAAQLAPQQTGLKRCGKSAPIRWAGKIDQFCVKCEDAPVKLVPVVPKDGATRYFAACLRCAYLRELDPRVIRLTER